MTALCGGGTSAPKPGSELAVNFTTAAISVALGEYGATWALKAIPFVASLPSFVLSTFCATDPPAIPTFTQAEADALLHLTFDGDFFSGAGKLRDLIEHIMWYQTCYCSSGTPTALPAAPAAPTGTGIPTNSPLPINPNCEGLHNSNGTIGPWVAPSFVFHSGDTSNPLAYLQAPTSVPTSWKLTLKNTTLTGAGLTFPFRYMLTTAYSAGGPPAGAPTVSVAPGATQTVVITGVPPNTFLLLWMSATTGTGTADPIGSTIEAFCGGDVPGGTQSPCCPPDATTQNTVDAILAMVTLIQRQIVPFASVHGSAHAGLTGNGTISVQGILGLKIDLTTTPGRVGQVAGDPLQLFDVGWINLGTADGFGTRVFITSDPMIVRPVEADVTVVGYSIPADCVVTITELIREP